ncbi:unnamed protein product [Amoebophrya sp. A25]|nr:unnamed protein product [Amoebophrya sp. A25]|eukprot:GSA25T00007405001.1
MGSGTTGNGSKDKKHQHKWARKHDAAHNGQMLVQQIEAQLAILGPSLALPPLLADMLRESPVWKLRKGVTLKLNLQRKGVLYWDLIKIQEDQEHSSYQEHQHVVGSEPPDKRFHLGTVMLGDRQSHTYELFVNLNASNRQKFGSVALVYSNFGSINHTFPAPFEVFARFLETGDFTRRVPGYLSAHCRPEDLAKHSAVTKDKIYYFFRGKVIFFV